MFRSYVLGEGPIDENGIRTGTDEHISIDSIYAIDIDGEYYEQIAQPWDSIETYNDFMSLVDTGTMTGLSYVERGQTYSIGNIYFTVYNTFTDESYDIPTGSLPNAASMAFELYTAAGENGDSILFLADLEQGNADLMTELWGTELQADYVQAAHHGQNLDYSFYEAVGAQTILVDAPDWLRQEDPNTHTSYEHIQWFNSEGYNVLTYNTTPNVIILHADS